MEGNVALMMEILGPSGIVIPTEQRAALRRSLAVKKRDARLRAITLWGRLLTSTGRDYLLARGCNGISPSTKHFDTHYYYSQDGVVWMDLQAPSEEIRQASRSIRGCFTGEPSHIFSVELPAVPYSQNLEAGESERTDSVEKRAEGESQNQGEAESQEGAERTEVKAEEADPEIEIRQDDEEDMNEDAEDGGDNDKSKVRSGFRTVDVRELERLATFMHEVDHDCGVVPKGFLIYNSKKELVSNVNFPGIKFPTFLDSYVHLFQSYEESPLSDDVKGSWSLEEVPFEGVILRSLWWPGYVFYYTENSKDFGSFYLGMGEKNMDLPFMI
ncbi:hypothetical protein KP509_01G023300 [Ceratopteris richardii]|uniref:Radial spoke head protein 9 homolog n=1 Tax=Ceratopteris richardii TaxID=49495 RepID=A0A8T2VMU6_CERRI|nr:hypothetical protein KP509_01G023300 [Ceratopteris richardii]